MKKKIKFNFFSESKKWPRRFPKIKKITKKTMNYMQVYFSKNFLFNINLIFSDGHRLSKLNKKYKDKQQDTDVLTFTSIITNKELGKIKYCDIFFSIDTIEKFVKKNEVNLYDHYNHLLIHSLLHINGYNHKTEKQFKKMKKEEIKNLQKFGITNPYQVI